MIFYGGYGLMIQTILWDVDGTLLDFLAAEEAAIRKLFVEFDMGECSDEMLTRYSKINRSYWERLERNEITKQQVLVGRFKEFFASEGLDAGVAEEFNAKYQYALGDTIVPRDNSLEIVRKLQGKVRQYVVSNGTIIAQNKKLRLSGLGALMDGIFLSEELGVEKPNIEFFEKTFSSIGQVDPRETIIIILKKQSVHIFLCKDIVCYRIISSAGKECGMIIPSAYVGCNDHVLRLAFQSEIVYCQQLSLDLF